METECILIKLFKYFNKDVLTVLLLNVVKSQFEIRLTKLLGANLIFRGYEKNQFVYTTMKINIVENYE